MDNTLKNKIKNHATPLDTQKLWKEIEPQVRNRKKRGFLVLWISGVTLLALSLLVILVKKPGWQKQPTLSHDLQSSQQVQTENTWINEEPTIKTSTQGLLNEKHPLAGSDHELGDQNLNPKSSHYIFKIKPSENQANVAQKVGPIQGESSKSSTAGHDSKQEIRNLPVIHSDDMTMITEKNKVEIHEIATVKKYPAHINSEYAKFELEPLQTLPIDVLILKNGNNADQTIYFMANKRHEFQSKSPILYKNWKPAIYLSAGISRTQNIFSANENESQPFQAFLHDSYRNIGNGQFNAGMEIQHKQGFYIKGQIGLTQIINGINIQRFEIDKQNIFQDTSILQINGLGQVNAMSGLLKQYKEINYQAQWYNYHRLLDFDIAIGYAMSIKNWKVGFDGGIGLNLLNRSRGKFINANYRLEDIAKADFQFYKNEIGLSYTTSIKFETAIAQKTNLFLQLYFKKYYNPMSNLDAPYSHAINNYGLNIGTKWSLSGFSK